jgi:DNA-binding TFAR19-related protein (PDSD5 family)
MKPKSNLLFASGVAVALNADTTLPEWIQLAPYGHHPSRDKKSVQVFNAEAAQQVIQWFNFFPRRLGRLMGLNACPVWVGHPDFAPETWPDRRQLGNVQELEAKEDGLYGRITWNADAATIINAEGHKFPSVAWDCDQGENNELHPAMLWSVGMWAKPNIKSVQPVINAEGYDDEEEDDDDKKNDDVTKPDPSNPSSLDKILAAFRDAGLIKPEDSEDTLLASVGNMISSLAYAREEKARRASEAATLRTAINAADDTPEESLLPTALEQLTNLRSQLTELNAARVEDALTWLIETGRVTKADESTVKTQLNADFASTIASLKDKKIQLNSQPLKVGGHKPDVMASHARAAKLADWIANHMAQTNCDYDTAWTASQTHADTAPLHAAMQQADADRAAS